MRTALQAAGIDYDSAEASFVPDMQVALDREGAGKVFRLVDALEDLDDVQNVFANFDVSDEVMEQLARDERERRCVVERARDRERGRDQRVVPRLGARARG